MAEEARSQSVEVAAVVLTAKKRMEDMAASELAARQAHDAAFKDWEAAQARAVEAREHYRMQCLLHNETPCDGPPAFDARSSPLPTLNPPLPSAHTPAASPYILQELPPPSTKEPSKRARAIASCVEDFIGLRLQHATIQCDYVVYESKKRGIQVYLRVYTRRGLGWWRFMLYVACRQAKRGTGPGGRSCYHWYRWPLDFTLPDERLQMIAAMID